MREALQAYGGLENFKIPSKILRSHPKFSGDYDKSSKVVRGVSEESGRAASEQEVSEKVKNDDGGLLAGGKRGREESKGRPGGRKAAKEAVWKREIQLKRMRKMDDLIQPQKEKNDLIKRHNDILLFSSPRASGTPEPQSFST